jgi:hypothetical protein
MCCFSGPVKEVSNTKIFARRFGKGNQYVVYQMKFESLDDLAMILPLPTPADAPDDAVTFINLKDYEHFFDDMRKGFPETTTRVGAVKGPPPPAPAAEPKLEVVDVGSFEASFVPRIKDFSRLDERFRLPDDVWSKLPQYKEYGFAVFKLKKGEHVVHPMAFAFPTALESELFFPTVHIHDGKVHDKAGFDHILYLQSSDENFMAGNGWRESVQPAGMFMDKKKAGSLILADNHVYRLRLVGNLKNADTLV